jgi:hypothetical protein
LSGWLIVCFIAIFQERFLLYGSHVSFLCHCLLFCSSYLCLLLIVINFRTEPIFVVAALCFVPKKGLKKIGCVRPYGFRSGFSIARSLDRLIDSPLGLLLGLSVLVACLRYAGWLFCPCCSLSCCKKGK